MKRIATLSHEYLKSLEGRGIAEGSIKRMRCYLRRFTLWMEGKDIRELAGVSIVEYIGFLRGRRTRRNVPLAAVSIETEIVMLKGFFEYLYKNEYLLTNPMEGIPLKLKEPKGERRIFSEDDISIFLDSIPISTATGQRDRAMFELCYSSGLRVGELARLTCGCVNLEERICFIKQSKGKKDRYVPFSKTALVFILKYLGDGRKKYEKWVRKSDMKEIVFLGRNGKMSWKSIGMRFRYYMKNCGLGKARYTVHSIRHATATHLLAHGASIRYVQELLGHVSLSTTQTYTRPDMENVKKMYRTYHPRENEFYVEMDDEYVRQVMQLKEDMLREKEYERRWPKKKADL
jgi:integrase/recombinase XerD